MSFRACEEANDMQLATTRWRVRRRSSLLSDRLKRLPPAVLHRAFSFSRIFLLGFSKERYAKKKAHYLGKAPTMELPPVTGCFAALLLRLTAEKRTALKAVLFFCV